MLGCPCWVPQSPVICSHVCLPDERIGDGSFPEQSIKEIKVECKTTMYLGCRTSKQGKQGRNVQRAERHLDQDPAPGAKQRKEGFVFAFVSK